MVEIALEDEFFESQVLGQEGVNVQGIEENQNDQEDWENNIVGFAKDWNNISLTHDVQERCVLVVDDLKEVVSQGS